jgi:glycine/D-amino acid oxidase-like deaminating enzyme
MQSRDLPGTADAVFVGGGTVGAWCACFLRQAGLSRMVLLEKGMLGQGASSQASYGCRAALL